MTKDEFKNEIINFFETESGLTIEQAKEKIRKDYFLDKYGNPHNDRIKTSNVVLKYIANQKYAGGIMNGFGPGWYISNVGFTGGSEVKLSKEF